jgi:hypothetical protein
MAQHTVLQWMDGRGWLVLSGGHVAGSQVRAQALGRIAADGGVAYISLGSSSNLGEQALADLDDLGAPPGYLVDVISEDDQTIQTRLADASMIVVEANSSVADLRSALIGAAADGIQAAYEHGAIILVEGLSAAVFGAWVYLQTGKIASGLDWLHNTLIVPGVTAIADSQAGREVLAAQPGAIAIGIGSGSALALGPDGEVEIWGEKQVTITLGRGYRPLT